MYINGMILEQMRIFIYAVLIGFIAIFVYDVIRILRRLITHHLIIENMEDFIYFVLLGLSFFVYISHFNSGEIRGYIILAFIIGGLIYHYFFSEFILKYLSFLIKLVLMPVKKLFYLLTLPILKLTELIKKFFGLFKKYLKISLKWLIIKVVECLRQLKNIIKYY